MTEYYTLPRVCQDRKSVPDAWGHLLVLTGSNIAFVTPARGFFQIKFRHIECSSWCFPCFLVTIVTYLRCAIGCN
ncbi:hypothetical protein EDB19DRAFT_1676441, partial [Suillus lakei]